MPKTDQDFGTPAPTLLQQLEQKCGMIAGLLILAKKNPRGRIDTQSLTVALDDIFNAARQLAERQEKIEKRLAALEKEREA